MIADYADLLVTAGEYVGRNDFAHIFPRLVGLAEMKLNRQLRVADMERTEAVTVTEGSGPLPEGFLEARSVQTASGRVLRSYSIQALESAAQGCPDVPFAFAVQGRNVIIRPVWSGVLTFSFYGKIPGLSPANHKNWLLETAPDIYLYAVVEEISIWAKDPQGAAAAAGIKTQMLSDLRSDDERSRFGQNRVRIGGVTP
ncbi:hypothetical protein J9800_04065 [Ochrobactrum sp. AP1BH01-1]|jgi:hypothetical protein|nr:hypothetical protein [Ochrobactrum sp. AP1BH01-1]MBQ0707843.1 hypothetical protein [Ochrobactrum sp. AP1BH01-1]